MAKISNSQKYSHLFSAIFDGVKTGSVIWLDDLLGSETLPNVSIATKKKYLREYVDSNPTALEKLLGFYPSANTIVSLVELKLEKPITEIELYEANNVAREIVKNITEPILENFLTNSLSQFVSDKSIQIPIQNMMDFLQQDFTEFLAKSGNGLVSIAGTVNEQLLQRAMENSGMTDSEFQRTGKNSDADFKIYSSSTNRYQIGVEVKSYHARERLLRGLQDIEGYKVGFGYFVDASEFNAHRTQTLLQSEAAAIYMPQVTLDKVEATAKEMTTNQRIAFGSRFYRPIECFVSDMKYFCKMGNLPAFT